MKERNVSVPLNLITTKIADTLPSQIRHSPHLFACAQKISTLVFSLPSSWWNSLLCYVSVQYICFSSLGGIRKDFDL